MAQRHKIEKKRPFFSYFEEDLQKAIKAHTECGMSKKQASLTFEVPRSTLRRKVSGQVSLQRKMGPSPELSATEEKILVDWIIRMARKGLVLKKDLEGAEVKSMQKAGLAWKWPLKDDILYYFCEDIICNIKEPVKENNRGLFDVPEMNKYM